jgi:hypothetical protein
LLQRSVSFSVEDNQECLSEKCRRFARLRKNQERENGEDQEGKEGGKHVSQNDDVLMCLRTII